MLRKANYLQTTTVEMFALRQIVIFALIVLTVDACFLNSCPYRRFERAGAENCGTCGKEGEGICITNGVCCSETECTEDKSCDIASSCPLPTCEMDKQIGFCASSTLCCSEKFCQRNLNCMVATAKKLKLR
ncbi:hypothetical protein M3Y96_00861500 [Aphelenchoides besseyi]|nr:hypothetical protein M3Y96_00861500 [Aphelenchoides besseyi]